MPFCGMKVEVFASSNVDLLEKEIYQMISFLLGSHS